MNNKYSSIEFLDINETIAPPSISKLFCLKRLIKLKSGDDFNLFKSLKYYWLNTKSLRIEDNYLRDKKQFPVLINLLKNFKNIEQLIITTNFLEQSDKDKTKEEKLRLEEERRLEFKRKVFEETNLNPIFEVKQIHDRHYFTDEFDIELSCGLDFFDKYFRVWRDKVTIMVSPLESY